MPEPVTPVTAATLFTLEDAGEITPGDAVLRSAAIGFCGKLPARGDFVGSGLPRAFVEPWHDWLQSVLAASRQILGEDWVAAWLEAPVWRFALSSDICGPDPVLGLWMPSVDRVGRYFPLTFAAVMPGGGAAALIRAGGGFLELAESAGLDALNLDLTPDAVAARLASAAFAEPGDSATDPELWPEAGTLWWTAGSPRVPHGAFAAAHLPNAAIFAGMLDAGSVPPPAQGQDDVARDSREP